MTPRGTPFDEDLLERIKRVVQPGDELRTLTRQHPNKIISIERDGIRVSTVRSTESGVGPKLVPAWMITRAWNQLRTRGYLTREGLTYGLGVNRSTFVCALLSTFPEVKVESTRPTLLRLNP